MRAHNAGDGQEPQNDMDALADNAEMSEPNGQSSSREPNIIFNAENRPIEDDLDFGLVLEDQAENRTEQQLFAPS